MPDVEKGRGFDTLSSNYCGTSSQGLHSLMNFLTFVHAFCFFATLYREIYEVTIGNIASIMKGVEVFATCLYIGSVIMNLNAFNDILVQEKGSLGYPLCATDPVMVREWSGTIESWLLIEVLVFGYFLLTMIFLMIKSRFT